MDPVVEFQRTLEQERVERDRQARDVQKHKHELEEHEKQAHHEIQVGMERGWTGGWGDLTTWLWILLFVLLAGFTPFICYWIKMGWSQTHWHLGFPPTGPG